MIGRREEQRNGEKEVSHRRRLIGRRSLVVGCLVLLVGCSPGAGNDTPTFVPPPTQGPPAGSTYSVVYGTVEETIEARGRVVAKREAPLAFQTGGMLKAVHVSPGDEVEEGTLVAQLDAPEAAKAVEQARFALEQAETELEIAELQLSQAESPETAPQALAAEISLKQAAAALANAEKEYDEAIHRDWEPPEVTESYSQTLQMSRWNYQLAQAQLEQVRRSLRVNRAIQELRVEQARRSVERAREQRIAASEQLSNTRLTAPLSGVVVSIDKRAGDQVGPYETFGTIADPSELWVVATAVGEKADRITAGQPVTVQLDAYSDQEYTGSVLQVVNQTTMQQGKSAYEVTIAFDKGQDVPAMLRMGADVTIAGRSKEKVLVVPNRAIMVIGGQESVEVVREDGGTERVSVQTGISDGTHTEIVAGLQEGQEIRIP